jgi:hypothetical protein
MPGVNSVFAIRSGPMGVSLLGFEKCVLRGDFGFQQTDVTIANPASDSVFNRLSI